MSLRKGGKRERNTSNYCEIFPFFPWLFIADHITVTAHAKAGGESGSLLYHFT